MDIFCTAAVYPFQTEALSLSETLFLKTNGEWAPKVFWSKRAPKLNEGFGISRHYGIVLHYIDDEEGNNRAVVVRRPKSAQQSRSSFVTKLSAYLFVSLNFGLL